jgi:hypothetical protein
MIYGKSLCLLCFLGSSFSHGAIFPGLIGREEEDEDEIKEVCGKRKRKRERKKPHLQGRKEKSVAGEFSRFIFKS